MADTKISALTAVGTPAGTDEFAVNQSGSSKKETLAQIKAYSLTSPAFTAGSQSASSWPTWPSGSLLTTAEAGAIEYDGNAFYAGQSASNRGAMTSQHVITLTSGYTTASGSTSLQAMFNAPTNGTITVPANTTWLFEWVFSLSSMSSTSGTFSCGFLGTATYTRIRFIGHGVKSTAGPTASSLALGTTASARTLCIAGTATAGEAYCAGKLVIGTGGTIIPAVAVSIAAAFVVDADSYFRCWCIGSNTVQSVGNWS